MYMAIQAVPFTPVPHTMLHKCPVPYKRVSYSGVKLLSPPLPLPLGTDVTVSNYLVSFWEVVSPCLAEGGRH